MQHRRGPKTDRIVHRAFEPADAEVFHRLKSHPEVMRYTGEPPSPSVDAAREAITNYPDFERHGYGRWACVLEATGEVIGFSGLKWLDELGAADLGYRFFPEYWGKGLATESGRACVRFAFDTLHLDRVLALVLPDNAASLRVLDKLGFRLEDTIEYEGHSGVLRYGLARSGEPR